MYCIVGKKEKMAINYFFMCVVSRARAIPGPLVQFCYPDSTVSLHILG
jgi:hypothetical protein